MSYYRTGFQSEDESHRESLAPAAPELSKEEMDLLEELDKVDNFDQQCQLTGEWWE